MNIQYEFQLEKRSKKELYSVLSAFIKNAGFYNLEQKIDKTHVVFHTEMNNELIEIEAIVKNISECGWKDRTNIKRIQVSRIDNYHKTDQNYCFLLLGITYINDEPILVAWNPLKYIYHKTNRSAYVYDDVLINGFKNGYYKTYVNGEFVLVCRQEHFISLFEDYIHYSFVEAI